MFFFAGIQVGDGPVWEERQHGLVQLDFALVGSDANQGGHDTLGYGSQVMGKRTIVGIIEVGIQQH